MRKYLINVPKRKFKKNHKGKFRNRLTKPIYFAQKHKINRKGLRAMEGGLITTKQLKTFHASLRKYIKKKGRIKIFPYPHLPKSRKSTGVRMGKGKGSTHHWIAKFSAGELICEIASPLKIKVLKALLYAQKKLPLTTKIC